MSDRDPVLAHFDSLIWLLTDLKAEGIELEEHQFNPASFGSFVVVLARGGKSARFVWDAQEALLSISFGARGAKNRLHDANTSLPAGDGLFQEIASERKNLLAI